MSTEEHDLKQDHTRDILNEEVRKHREYSRREQVHMDATALAAREGIEFDQAIKQVIMALPPPERVMDMIKDVPAIETGLQPYEFVGQLKLFKAGIFGSSVSLWSCYEGGYPPAQVMLNPDEPVVVHLADEEIEDQVRFAAGYVCGYIEAVGGDLGKLKMWLVPG